MTWMRRLIRIPFLRTVVGYFPESAFGDFLRRKFWSFRLGQYEIEYVGFGADLDFNVIIGTGLVLGKFVHLSVAKSLAVYIGNDVSIGHGTYLRSANHRFDRLDEPIKRQGHNAREIPFNGRAYSIVIEDDVWIGANAVILTGTHIGTGSVVSAGSVISSTIPPYSVVTGNPARVIGNRKQMAALQQTAGDSTGKV